MDIKLRHLANHLLANKTLANFTGWFYNKESLETLFWRQELKKYIKWYQGGLKELYQCPAPKDEDKVLASNLVDSALLTWYKLHQQPKYLQDLELSDDVFAGLRILDVGAGPFPSARVFKDCEVYCLDPLYDRYLKIGYPMHYYDRVKFIRAKSEAMPLPDNYFDAVISVNALDHVDDLAKTVAEIKRTLKPSGKLALHVHYHPRTLTEPIVLNDEIMRQLFSWVGNFNKIKESRTKTGWQIQETNELYAIWRNF